jgi:hypothetical protein
MAPSFDSDIKAKQFAFAILLEAGTGIEPVRGGFADRSVTTSPPSHYYVLNNFLNFLQQCGPCPPKPYVGGTSPPSQIIFSFYFIITSKFLPLAWTLPANF